MTRLGAPAPWSRALVTGASSGIGRAIARELAARGVKLVIVARGENRLRELADELRLKHRVEVEVLPADLTDPAALEWVCVRLEADPFVDLVVNNAGVGGLGRFTDTDIERALRLVDLNVVAPTTLAHAAISRMSREGRGSLLTVSSLVAMQPMPNQAVYGATKAYVSSLFEALHEETRGTPINVTTVMPGFVRTEFKEHVGAPNAFERAPEWLWLTPERVAKDAVDAAAAGRAVLVPSRRYHASALVVDSLPRSLRRHLASRLAGSL